MSTVLVRDSAVELYDYQKVHANNLCRALDLYNSALDGSDTGTGKTVVALEACRRMDMVPFVICPKAVVPVWKDWMDRFGFRVGFANTYEKLRGGRTEFVKRRGKAFEWKVLSDRALLIFDEVHRCKGDKSINSKLLASTKDQGLKTLMLSATAISRPQDLKAIGYHLGMHGHKDWWRWCLHHGCRRGRFGGLDFNNDPKVLKGFHEHIYEEGFGSRIRIADLPEGSFPETVISANGYEVQDPDLLDHAYADMARRLDALEEKRADDEENPLTIQIRARQEAELCKVPTLVELTTDYIDSGNAVAIFVNFKETLDALYEWLYSKGVTISMIRGDQVEGERSEHIRSFQDNESSVCLVMSQAGGTGLSLHDETGNRPRVSLISPSFSAIELRQVLGRVHRASGKSPSIQNIVFANGTVEMKVCRAVRAKLNNLDLVNDDDLNPIL